MLASPWSAAGARTPCLASSALRALPLTPLHLRARSRPRRLPPSPPRALFGLADDGGAGVGALLMGGAVAAALGLSLVPLVTGASEKRNAGKGWADMGGDAADDTASARSPPAAADDDADEVKWGAMSVISCIPLLNWMASARDRGRRRGRRSGRGQRGGPAGTEQEA